MPFRGDDTSTALADRGEWHAMLSAPSHELLARFAAFNAALMTRTARVLALGESAAATDPELAEQRDRGHQSTRTNPGQVAAALNQRGALAPDISERQATDILYALAAEPAIFLRLTDDCGWTPAQYAELLERTLTASLGTP